MGSRSAEKRYVAADLRKTSHFARSRRVVLALAILFGLLAVAILPARRHVADALLLAHGDNVDALARSYAEQIVDPSFLAQIRPRIRPIDGHRLSDEGLRASISAHSVDSAGLVHVTVRADSAKGAEALANDIAVAFGVAVKQEAQQHEASVRDELRLRLDQRTREISRLRKDGKSSAAASEHLLELEAERTALVDQLANASVLGARRSVAPVLVAAPHATLEPLLPRLLRRLFEGLLLGAVLGLAVVRLLGLRARRERGTRRVPVRHAAQAASATAGLDWQLLDDLKPLTRTARPEPEPEPEPQLEPAPRSEPKPESLPQPVVRVTVPPPRPLAQATLSLVADPPLPPSDPPVIPDPAPAPVAVLPRAADMLELAELERLVIARPASDPFLQEERHALLVSLRGYTGLDGVIPTRFHSLVHESFGDLLSAGSAVGVQG